MMIYGHRYAGRIYLRWKSSNLHFVQVSGRWDTGRQRALLAGVPTRLRKMIPVIVML